MDDNGTKVHPEKQPPLSQNIIIPDRTDPEIEDLIEEEAPQFDVF
jgi:hypothetical protein